MKRRQRPLIAAKLNVPEPRPNYIRRTALHERLTRLPDYKVTIIKGAPGSGKSTLLAAYVKEDPSLQARWVSLDADDNDMRTLWSYVLEALRPELGPQAGDWRELLDATLQAGDVNAVLVELMNGLQPEEDVFLVLDDAHYITAPDVVESLQFFLRYCSDKVHLVLLSRDDPALDVNKLRMDGQVLEFNNDDLKVTASEARQFLTNTLGLQQDESTIDRVVQLAEGWVGGLQLLGVALEGQSGDVESLRSAGPPVAQYLAGEIFNALEEDEGRFLISTCMLPYFDESVGRAVSGRDDAGALLERIISKNLFIVTVDGARGLYRYHHLFQQFLQQQFMKLPKQEQLELHGRAAQFYRSVDDTDASVRYCLLAERYDDALDLIGRMGSGVKSWRLLQKVPLSALEGKLDLIFQRLFSHLAEHDYEQCAHIVAHFRNRFDEPLANRLLALVVIVLNDGAFDLDTEHWSVAQFSELPLGDETKAIVYSFLAVVLNLKEQGQEALAFLREADRIIGHVDNPYIRFYCMELKSQVWEHMGDLQGSATIYEDMFRLVERHSFLKPIVVTAQIGVVGVLLKGGKLDEAEAYLDKVEHRVAHNAPLEIAYLYNRLELHMLQGDGSAAANVVEQLLERDVLDNPLYCSLVLRYMLMLDMAHPGHVARFQFEHIAAPHWQDFLVHARLLQRDGRGEEALRHIEERLVHLRKQQAKLPLVDTLLLKVQLLLADEEASARAEHVGDRAPGAEHVEGRAPRAELGVGNPASERRSVARDSRNFARDVPRDVPLDVPRDVARDVARDALREAIHYSYENDLLAPFLLTDETVFELLRTLRSDPNAEFRGAEADFLDELIRRGSAARTGGAAGAGGAAGTGAAAGTGSAARAGSTARNVGAGLLSERETDVLHVLAEGATNRQIAERLYISVATVKTHIVNIYSKMNVSNRVEAVEKARRLGLVE